MKQHDCDYTTGIQVCTGYKFVQNTHVIMIKLGQSWFAMIIEHQDCLDHLSQIHQSTVPKQFDENCLDPKLWKKVPKQFDENCPDSKLWKRSVNKRQIKSGGYGERPLLV